MPTDSYVQVVPDSSGKLIDNSAVVAVALSSIAPWTASTAFVVGDIRQPNPSNGHVYIVTVAGTSGSTQPNFPTTNQGTVTDGGVTWTENSTVQRQRINWSDPTDPLGHAMVLNRKPLDGEYGALVRAESIDQLVDILQRILVEFKEFRSLIECKIK